MLDKGQQAVSPAVELQRSYYPPNAPMGVGGYNQLALSSSFVVVALCLWQTEICALAICYSLVLCFPQNVLCVFVFIKPIFSVLTVCVRGKGQHNFFIYLMQVKTCKCIIPEDNRGTNRLSGMYAC